MGNWRLSAPLAIILVSSATEDVTYAAAQELTPLTGIIGQSEETYPLLRCAALYQSFVEWAGPKVLGQGQVDKYQAATAALLNAAISIRMENSGDTFAGASEGAALDVSNIADLYILRMRANYAASGQAFGSDPLIRSDMSVCNLIIGGGS
jgi:hypothetical protein